MPDWIAGVFTLPRGSSTRPKPRPSIFSSKNQTMSVLTQLLGAALIGKQDFDQALLAFSKLIQLRPDDPNAYVNLALVEISRAPLPGGGTTFEESASR